MTNEAAVNVEALVDLPQPIRSGTITRKPLWRNASITPVQYAPKKFLPCTSRTAPFAFALSGRMSMYAIRARRSQSGARRSIQSASARCVTSKYCTGCG
ncbi:MAG: hypothetical protein QOG14_4924 [Mycobacterium sp.]|nr:hypothetical protein [Mycobacterium sp.]